ncbi:MAG: DUF4330 domain-containing protein [Clostridiales bacterium]|jgi:hypothetical protein|nr:DUF4330 domain-containing protein [Clostridiales bacterium]
MLIDKEGKIFGKINVIDLFILLAVLALAAFLILRAARPSSTGITVSADSASISFVTESTYDFVAEAVQMEDRVEDESKGVDLGRVTNITVGPGYTFAQNDQGQIVKSFKEGYAFLELTSEVKGQFFENGIMINGQKYAIGHGLTVRAGKAKIYMYISDIQKK